MSARRRTAASARCACAAVLSCVLAACGPTPADTALQACRDLVTRKSGVPIHVERRSMQISALPTDAKTLRISGPLSFVAADGTSHLETLDCSVRIGDDRADVIHLELSWSLQELERTLRETR